ncbi:MAG: 50S ribosomal protein L6 [Gammaproteobacteria bacterium]|nr:50S ribosomal protein L6 [Gammaproteobacteria bacterium]
MSRVAKANIILPAQVEIEIGDNNITVKGPKGTLTQHCNRLVAVKRSESDANVITFQPAVNEPKAWAHAGTVRALVHNMVHGVTEGFELTLELVGVGYRAQAKPNAVTLSLGFSHPIEYALVKGVTAETPSNTVILLKSIDKQLLGQVASEIRAFRPPEPYKGKGVRYAGEVIVMKEAKKK